MKAKLSTFRGHASPCWPLCLFTLPVTDSSSPFLCIMKMLSGLWLTMFNGRERIGIVVFLVTIESYIGVTALVDITVLWSTVPFAVEKRDEAVGMRGANHSRVMGSFIGLVMATSVFDAYVEPRLASIGIVDPVDQLTNPGLGAVPGAVEFQVSLTLSEGYNRQMLVLCALTAAQIPAVLLMWKRKKIVPA